MEENNNFLYKGYLLVVSRQSWCHWWSECKELEYYATSSSIPFLKELFKQFVDEKLAKEKEMTEQAEEDYGWKVKFIGFYYHNGYVLKLFSVDDVPNYFPRSYKYVGECDKFLFSKFAGDTVEDVKARFIDSVEKNKMPDKVVEKKEEKRIENSTKETSVYKGYFLEVILDPTLNLYKGVCKELNLTIVEEVVENLQDRFISYINSWRLADKSTEDKDKKIAKLIEVIDGLNKKLEEKDTKIERLKSKISAIKLEVNKSE